MPVNYSDKVHTKRYNVTDEELIGMLLTATQIVPLDRIALHWYDENDISGPIAITDAFNTDYIVGNTNAFYVYTCELGSLNVQFNNMDFVNGCVSICILFGVDPSMLIRNISKSNIPIEINFGFYIGSIDLEETINEPNLVHLSETIIDPEISEALLGTLHKCFYVDVGVYLPSKLIILSSNSEYNNVIASVSATPLLYHLPEEYQQSDAWYIYNVCTEPNFRGHGFSKSALIVLLNELIVTLDVKTFLLEVEPTNIPAYKLYQSLGFIKLNEVISENKLYDLMLLAI
jgi:hypothetical protein